MRLFSLALLVASASAALKVQLSPVSLIAHPYDGFSVWQIADETSSATTTLSGIKLTLETVTGGTFKGGRYKVVSEQGYPAGSYVWRLALYFSA